MKTKQSKNHRLLELERNFRFLQYQVSEIKELLDEMHGKYAKKRINEDNKQADKQVGQG